jgi:gamma-glutamyltranspeptidase/glutathione hydrolase
MPLAQALDRARCVLGQTWGSPHASLLAESRFDEGVIEALRTAGHAVEVLSQAYADSMGHAGAVLLHPNGTLEGAHDPRADGGAAGL